MENENLVLKVKPKFKFIYELAMPTGKKILASVAGIIFLAILWIILEINKTSIYQNSANNELVFAKENIDKLWIVFVILIGIILIKLIFNLIIQIMQYNAVSYSFYETYMIYEDKFLNKHTKKIQYANIKEIEIKRSIWDRLNKKGIIIIYTNAENAYSNGLVIYALEDPEATYKTIDEIIHNHKNLEEKKEEKTMVNEDKYTTLKKSEDFKKKL